MREPARPLRQGLAHKTYKLMGCLLTLLYTCLLCYHIYGEQCFPIHHLPMARFEV